MKLLVYDDDDGDTAHDAIDKFFYNYTSRVYGWDETPSESEIRMHYVGRRWRARKTSWVLRVPMNNM